MLIILTLVLPPPLYFTVIASVSEPMMSLQGRCFSSGLYNGCLQEVFKNSEICVYLNSVIYTVRTLFSHADDTCCIRIKQKELWQRYLSTYFVITMFFGLIPTYTGEISGF